MTTRAPSRFLGNTVALATSTVLATALTLAQMKILAANLPLAVFGLFASLRGLSLLVSMLAANGFPQLLVRFLPEQAAHDARSGAVRLSATALAGTVALCALQLVVVAAFAGTFFRQVPGSEDRTALLAWFAVTAVGVALKLVLYGGFNGLRRFGSQTVLEVVSLAVQVAWMAAEAHTLTLTRLFEITGVTSLGTALVALPWYARAVAHDVPRVTGGTFHADYAGYWKGAVGLSIVALAFTDVDRWILSNVLVLESLSLFHVASRIARLANRFIAIPVLAFQPEATRVHAEGRPEALDVSTRAFFKASVLLSAFTAVAIIVYADPLIRLASGTAFLGARPTLWLLAASIPLSAMTAPMTAVMKALDGVRSALACDLAWAAVYVALLLSLAGPLGVAGAGVAQLTACVVQLALAFRLASTRPRVADALGAFFKSIACAAAACVPVVVAQRAGAPLAVVVGLGLPAVWLYVRVARRAGVLTPDERERLRGVVGERIGASPLMGWLP